MKPFNNSFATNRLRQEDSVTGAGEAYAASLNSPKKKQNPYAEDALSGYKELKGFRAGHTKDTGGFQYKDLWGVNEADQAFQVDDQARVTLKGNINYNKIGDVIDVTKDGKYYTLKFKNGVTAIYHQSDVTKPSSVKSFEDKPRLDIDEDKIQEAYIPDNIKSFAKRKGITSVVNQVARWAEKAGKRIVGGTAIGKDYSTLILDLTYQGGQIRINTDSETIEVNGEDVDDYASFMSALEGDSLNENYQVGDIYLSSTGEKLEILPVPEKYKKAFGAGVLNIWVKDVSTGKEHFIPQSHLRSYKKIVNENYSRFKKETVTRSKEQQMHEAMKLVRKKLYEADKVMDYVKTMKEELGLQEYKSHTRKLMERIQTSIAEIYKKYKNIK